MISKTKINAGEIRSMMITQAIAELRVFTSKMPSEAFDVIRTHWKEAEPILLEAIQQRLRDPTTEEEDALFLYAIYLCAEMRCSKVFPYFICISRQPNLVVDHLLGDIVTETLPQMLARTCDGRIDEIKALIEDPAVNQYVRGTAMESLLLLFFDDVLSREQLSEYCVELLENKLERRESLVWDSVVSAAGYIQADNALPLIKKAYEYGFCDEYTEDLLYVVDQYEKTLDVVLTDARKSLRILDGMKSSMSFFVPDCGKSSDDPSDDELLGVLDELEKVTRTVDRPAVGRNAPCPCGSGKKYKKCCIDKLLTIDKPVPRQSVLGSPIRNKFIVANDWMEAGYLHSRKKPTVIAFECWNKCWQELCGILPPELQDLGKAEDTGVFIGVEFLVNWVQDFEELIIYLAERNLEVAKFAVRYFAEIPKRFPDLDESIKQNILADRAYCLAMLGRHDEAITILDGAISDRPDSAQAYTMLADMFSVNSLRFNIKPDIHKATQYFKNALRDARDCEDYDVKERLEDINSGAPYLL